MVWHALFKAKCRVWIGLGFFTPNHTLGTVWLRFMYAKPYPRCSSAGGNEFACYTGGRVVGVGKSELFSKRENFRSTKFWTFYHKSCTKLVFSCLKLLICLEFLARREVVHFAIQAPKLIRFTTLVNINV